MYLEIKSVIILFGLFVLM